MQRTTIITLQVVNLITHLLKQSRIAMQNLMKFCPNIPPASQKIELPNTLLSILFSCCQATHLIHWVEQPEGQTWSYLGHRRVQLEMKWKKRRKRKIRKSVISVVIQVNHDPQFFFLVTCSDEIHLGFCSLHYDLLSCFCMRACKSLAIIFSREI